MNTFYKQITVLLLILLSTIVIEAQESVSKKIVKKFAFTNQGDLTIDSKYGDIVVNGWEKDSIVIVANIKVTDKKLETAKDLLDRQWVAIRDNSGLDLHGPVIGNRSYDAPGVRAPN